MVHLLFYFVTVRSKITVFLCNILRERKGFNSTCCWWVLTPLQDLWLQLRHSPVSQGEQDRKLLSFYLPSLGTVPQLHTSRRPRPTAAIFSRVSLVNPGVIPSGAPLGAPLTSRFLPPTPASASFAGESQVSHRYALGCPQISVAILFLSSKMFFHF